MEYPYYVIPDIEALSSATGEERQRLTRRIAILVGDPKALREILGNDSDNISDFCNPMPKPALSTSDTIDSFLDTFGDPTAAQSKEVREVEELVPLPPGDYDLSSIDADPIIIPGATSVRSDETSDAIDAFLDPEKDEANDMPEKREEAPVLSESLARAMIKNGNYVKALEIITDLSLNNPKKSIYFADQIRFLKKLILNQSKQNKQ